MDVRAYGRWNGASTVRVICSGGMVGGSIRSTETRTSFEKGSLDGREDDGGCWRDGVMEEAG